jgi:hypothetical protein
MNLRRNPLVLAMGGMAVLALLLGVVLVSGPAVAASQTEGTTTSEVGDAPDYTFSTAPVPPGAAVEDLSPPDLPSPADGDIDDEGEPEPPGATSRAGETGEAPDYMFSTVPVPPGTPIESLSPPDLPPSVASQDEVAAPLASYSYLRVTGSALRPRGSDVEWRPGGAGGCIYALSGSTIQWWNTPVYLPQGATVKYLRMYYNDTSSSNCQGYFTAYDLYGDIEDEWGISSSGNSGENFRDTSEFTHTVDYSSYSYVINWRPNDTGNDMQLCGFRVFYYPPTAGVAFLPTVFKNYP